MTDRKVWLAILGIVVLVSGFLLFINFRATQTEKSLRIQSEQALASKTAELTQVQTQLADLKKQKSELEDRLEDALALQEFTQEEHERETAALNSRLATIRRSREL